MEWRLRVCWIHWIFLPQLQRHLNLFQEAWNNHKLRTTGSQSSLQLWTTFQSADDPDQVHEDMAVCGVMFVIFFKYNFCFFPCCCKVSEDFGIDWEGPSCSNEMEGVAVPQAQLQRELTAAEMDTLPSPDVLFQKQWMLTVKRCYR